MSLSAGGQLEHPCDVNSSRTAIFVLPDIDMPVFNLVVLPLDFTPHEEMQNHNVTIAPTERTR